MQLNVAPAQSASGTVSVGQGDRKGITSAGFAVIGHVHHIGEALTVDIRVALDMARIRTGHRVSCDTSSVHVHTASVVVILQMAPERALTDAATDTEVSFGAGGCGNPPAAGHEVLALTTTTTTTTATATTTTTSSSSTTSSTDGHEWR